MLKLEGELFGIPVYSDEAISTNTLFFIPLSAHPGESAEEFIKRCGTIINIGENNEH